MIKKALYIGFLALAAGSFVSCNETFDKEPLDKFVVGTEYWSKTANVDAQLNTFYEQFIGYGNGGTNSQFYFSFLSDDQVGADFQQWKFTNAPASSSSWNDPFTEIRRANTILAGVESSTLSEAQKVAYYAFARLMRGYEYYLLVRAYGDVPLYDHALDASETDAIYGPRTDRDQVMDFVLEDLNYAVANLADNTSKVTVNKAVANAMKAEICLYEGTYCKYRTAADNAGKGPNTERANKFLTEAVNACQFIMGKGYSLSDNYGDIYNSTDLSSNSEIIMFKNYVQATLMHSVIDYTSSSTQMSGMSKDAFDAYLFVDGKPLATTDENKSDAAVVDGDKLSLEPLMAVRDKRLAAQIDHVLLYNGRPNMRKSDDMAMTSSTGYGVLKFDNLDIPTSYRSVGTSNYTDGPLYWLAMIYLEYAEAKAELGTITQADLDNTINKLQARAGLPNMSLTPAADPANNHGVSNLLWEIRRARRCELMFDGYRYWDLIRWHQLDKLDTQKYPNILLGANIVNDTQEKSVTLSGNYIAKSGARVFDKKHYFYPIPTGQITLNPNLGQNPGW